MKTFLLIIVLCGKSGCDSYVIDHDLTLEDCNQARIDTLIHHQKNEKNGNYGGYIQAAECTIEDKE